MADFEIAFFKTMNFTEAICPQHGIGDDPMPYVAPAPCEFMDAAAWNAGFPRMFEGHQSS